MPIKESWAKLVKVDYVCDTQDCDGFMEPTGLCTVPRTPMGKIRLLIQHKCNKCESVQDLDKTYPCYTQHPDDYFINNH